MTQSVAVADTLALEDEVANKWRQAETQAPLAGSLHDDMLIVTISVLPIEDGVCTTVLS